MGKGELNQYEKIAYDIADDIYEEHGDSVHGSIDLQSARETVETYGYVGEELEEISRFLVAVMEGEL
jgi:hypothetical protein